MPKSVGAVFAPEHLQMNAAVKKEYMESTLNMSGVLGSFMAVVAALVALITLNLHTDMPVSIMAGVLMVIASVLTVKEDIQLSIVNAFDSRISVKMVYGLGILSALFASLASGFVVFICTLAGRPISDELGIPFLDKISNQLLSGIAIGVACLGLFTFVFYALHSMGIVRISPELSDRTVYTSGCCPTACHGGWRIWFGCTPCRIGFHRSPLLLSFGRLQSEVGYGWYRL
jgi:hypothetical protein